ncbi:MAG: hypothetical protein AABX91_02275 [Nanoarchaeota archaeon]
MKGENIKAILIQVVSLLLAFIVMTLVKGDELIFTVTILAILLINFKIKYYKNEWALFFVGLVLGFFIEVVLGLVYRMQYWENPTLLGVPIWLPIVWGYAFVFIRRIGNAIIENK